MLNTTFTNHDTNTTSPPPITFPGTNFNLDDDLHYCLINSDPNECNKNISLYIKSVTELAKDPQDTNYHQLSIHAMNLITSNMFVRNYSLCIGKLLGLLTVFTNIQKYESQTGQDIGGNDVKVMEFVCIVMFLVLKLKNSDEEDADLKDFNENIPQSELFDTFRCCNFTTIIANFMVSHIHHNETSFVLLKFCCDMVFEYLFHVVLLSDQEFEGLVTKTELIPSLITDLLHNNSLHDYNINEEEWENEEKLIAYEEFKLLLLINEQYLMKSYSCREVRNQVFDGLMTGNTDGSSDSINSNISGFMNLLVFHLNREESQIIKILISKFLYLIFTSSYTAKLYYLNDLKILVDIFVRELNDMEYLDEEDAENRILVLTYLRVMYPMMTFSQLADLSEGYKNGELTNTLTNLISNISSVEGHIQKTEQLDQISDLAKRCLSVPWLKKKKKTLFKNTQASSSTSSLNSNSSLTQAAGRPVYERSNSSTDSMILSFTRVASVRASTRNDYHMHTTRHNVSHSKTAVNLALENNNNVFLQKFDELKVDDSTSRIQKKLEKRQSNILDLPHEYLSKLPEERHSIPQHISRTSPTNSVSSVSSESSLVNKARKKKAPPPPPGSPGLAQAQPLFTPFSQAHTPVPEGSTLLPPVIRETKSLSPSPQRNPPPPPPPRRRR